MGLLGRGIALGLLVSASACYSPDLRDCTVTCVAETDCAAGQICGSDRFCASPALAGQCATSHPDDGGMFVRDAGDRFDSAVESAIDAAPDGPPMPSTTTLHVHVDGQGTIVIVGLGACDSAEPQHGDCHYDVELGSQITASAQAHPDWRFDRWTNLPCATQDSTCSFTALVPTNVTARFRKDD